MKLLFCLPFVSSYCLEYKLLKLVNWLSRKKHFNSTVVSYLFSNKFFWIVHLAVSQSKNQNALFLHVCVLKKSHFSRDNFGKSIEFYRNIYAAQCLNFNLKLKLVGKSFIIHELTLLQTFVSNNYWFSTR